MSQKIRIGNDIDIRWSLVDGDEQPYILEGRNVSIELNVGQKKVRIKELELDGNTVHFVYYGKDQKYTGSYILKFIENDGVVDMVTFDTKDAFTLVPHSWEAVDSGEEPERIYLEFITVTSSLVEKIGPKGDDGDSAYQVAVNNGFVGTEEEWLASLKGEPGEVTQQSVIDALGYTPVKPESAANKIWAGTREQYEALTPSADTLYFIREE